MMRPLFCWMTTALILVTIPAQALDARQFHKEIPGGINQLQNRAGAMLLKDGTDSWHRLTLSDGKITLSAAAAPKPAAISDPHKLPDTELVTGKRNIKRAWFSGPTSRYGHGVLGDAIEAEAITAELADGSIVAAVLEPSAVFEDRTPRLVDVNNDGHDEILVVKSYLRKGAAVSLVGQVDDQLQILAEAPAIGIANRWLNPVGAADFDGDGTSEIAVVITPHIGGTLQLYEWQGNRLIADHNAFGFSNHAMGSRELGLSAILDVNHDGVMDIIVPDAGRTTLVATSFNNAKAHTLARIDVTGRFTSGLFTVDLNGDGRSELIFATEDSRLSVLEWYP